MQSTKPRCVVVAIDGPAGSGKSTAAHDLARRLHYVHLNSGALFRAVGLLAREHGVALDNGSGLAELARATSFSFALGPNGDTRFLVNNRDITAKLFSDEAGSAASVIGLCPELREVLCEVQRDTAKRHPLVVEGRDAGSVVFPDAEVKFYLEASIEVRAMRRLRQLTDLGLVPPGDGENSLREIREEIKKRDFRDQNREVAPGIRASDAILIETSHKSPAEVSKELAGVIDKLLICEKEG